MHIRCRRRDGRDAFCGFSMDYLKRTITIKQTTFKNRLVMPPMSTAKCGDDGQITDQVLAYYDEKSKGGYIGLIIQEYAYINQEGKANKGQISVSRDSDMEGLRQLTDLVHKNGSKIFAQINHAGSGTGVPVTGMQGIAPSAVMHPFLTDKPKEEFYPREMTVQEIKKVVKDYAAAAKRVRAAGFDGVELHAAHGYLLSQFYSPLTNLRTDAYGGSLSNRIRIHREVIRAVREAVGEDYIVAMRFGASDYREGGASIADAVEAAQIFEQEGIDLLDISAGFSGWQVCDTPGFFKNATLPIKDKVKIPCILTGGITQVREAEELLAEGAADFIGVGRAILKDSDWAKRAMSE